MVAVRVGRDENIEKVIKRFSKKVKKAEIIEQVLERRYYVKPSEKNREAKRRRKSVLKKLARQEKEDKEQ